MWNIRRNQSDRICPVGIRVFIYNKLPFAFSANSNLHKVMEMQIKIVMSVYPVPLLSQQSKYRFSLWNFIKTQFHGFFLFSSHRHIILPESYTLILKTCGSCRTFFLVEIKLVESLMHCPITESNHLIFR